MQSRYELWHLPDTSVASAAVKLFLESLMPLSKFWYTTAGVTLNGQVSLPPKFGTAGVVCLEIYLITSLRAA